MPYAFDIRTTNLKSLNCYRSLGPKEETHLNILKDEGDELHTKRDKMIREDMTDD